MAKKKFIKVNEARILIYINNAHVGIRFIRAIASKLGIDYAYTIHLLNCMKAKGWIQEERMPTKTYFHIRKKAPLDGAKMVMKENKVRS